MNSEACIFFPAMLTGLIKDTNGSTADLVFSLRSLHVERAVLITHTLEMLGRSEMAAGLWATFDDGLSRNIMATCKVMDKLCICDKADRGTLVIAWLFAACWAQLVIEVLIGRKASGMTENTHDQGIMFVKAGGFHPCAGCILLSRFCCSYV